jgi:predicted transposase YbfD/YdcC
MKKELEEQLNEQLRLAVLHFEDLPDPRIERSKQYPLVEIIVIALSAVLSGAESFYEIASFGKTKRDWLKRFISLANGIPSHDTFNRVFALLEPRHFQTCALDWVRAVIGSGLSPEDVLAIDGKQLCGSASENVRAVHMLNVWSHQQGLCLTSTAVDVKSNEITHIPGILETLSLLDIAGCIITVDALNTQRDVAREVKRHDAEYVMALKGNQGSLLEDLTWLFEVEAEPLDKVDNVFESRERSRGRDETRRCTVLHDLDYLEKHDWPGLQSVAQVICERTLKGKTTRELRYYLCSFKAEAAKVLHAVRTHWEVENKLHWTLDVVFGEDRHDYAERNGVENMSVLRQFCLNLLRQDDSKGSLKGKRKRAAWDDDFRASLLLKLNPS